MKTDHAMKTLVTEFAQAITTWLTGKPVVRVEAGMTNLPRPKEEIRSDMVFVVTPEDEGKFILHIEFQGLKTDKPMPRRELEYLVRITDGYPGLPILSVVLYVGKRAGSKDTGKHMILSPDKTLSLAWNYRVIHLWKMVADEVVETVPVAVLALIGQMRMNNPQQVLATAVGRVNAVEDAAMRKSLLQSMVDLIGDEEVLKMLKTLLIPESVLGETPFMKEIRLSREEGIQIGREEGMQEGVQKGVQIGREEGVREGIREGLLDGIVFVLDMKFGKNGLLLLPQIRQLKNPDSLKSLYAVIRVAKNFEDVQLEIHRLKATDDALNGVVH